jgi:glycerophosphoryl diester phosphodiesterase
VSRRDDPRRGFRLLASLFVAGSVAVTLAQTPSAPKKQLIAHRGASAYAPEHTIAAYTLAIEQHADFVEQDLAVTKDGVVVCIHDLTLERTTNVEEVFPHRFATDAIDVPAAAPGAAQPAHHWLVNDFTLAEIKRLDAGSWFGPAFAGATIPTFQEAVDLVRGKAGMYPELKDPEFYRRRGIRTDALLAAALKRNGLVANPKTPVIIQSFDDAALKQLARDLPQVPRVFLLDPQSAARVDAEPKLREIATWATGVAPNKAIVDAHPEVVQWAHAAGLTVTLWTFRSSTTTFPSVREEMTKFLYDIGVDAVFTDNPDQFPRR